MQQIDGLFHGKWLITCNENDDIYEDYSLAIDKNKIIDILPTTVAKQKYQASETHNYSDHALLPGFFNCHTHSAMTLFRGLADDLALMDWLNNYIWPAEGKWVSPEFVYDGTELAAAEMIRSGTICFNDMYFYLGDAARAAQDAGMRAAIGITVIDVPTPWAKNSEAYFEKGLAFYEDYKNNPFIQVTLAPHSTYASNPKDLMRVKELADKYHLRTNIHLHEDPGEMEIAAKKYQMRSIPYLNKIGLLNKDLIGIHVIQLNDRDLELLHEHKPNVVHCPESNMKLGSLQICPVEKLHRLGVNVALGTDGAASNNDLDMISEMRTAAILGKQATTDPTAVSARQALRMATINGARALGIDAYTGSLEIGKSADFIAIDLSDIESQPLYNPISQIVYSTSRNQVTDVWVAGKQLLKQRKLQTLDEKEIIKKAQEWRKKIKLSV